MTSRLRDDMTRVGGPVMTLLCLVVVVALVTFALSFIGLTDYGGRVAGVPHAVSWLVPIGVDCLTLAAIAATFALRTQPLNVRAYAWLVFTLALAASVAGNLSHAYHRHLSWDGEAGAAAWPALLALASHLAVVTWRRVERQAVALPPPFHLAVAAEAPDRPKVTARISRRQDVKLSALALIAAGSTQKEAAAAVGKSERQVARWVADQRKATATDAQED